MRLSKSLIVFCFIAFILPLTMVLMRAGGVHAFDKPPFILLNLMLSFQAAYTGPILLIAANRSAERDRLTLEHNAHETEQHTEILKLLRQNLDINSAQTSEIHEAVTRQSAGAKRRKPDG